MIARERSVGVITFVAAESRYRYDERDLELTQELARRAALAVDNARLYDAERTARLQAEEAQVRFRGLFEGVPDAILVVDAGAIHRSQRGCLPDARVRSGRLAHHGSGRPLLQSRRGGGPGRKIREAGEWRTESELLRRDRTQIPVEIWSRRLDLPTVRSVFPSCATSPLNSRPIRFEKRY